MKNTENKTLALGCAVLFLSVPAALLRGWVLSLLWAWFVVPLGVPPITYLHAVGISLLASLLTHKNSPADDAALEKKNAHEKIVEGIATMLVGPLFVLLLGWLIHLAQN